VRTSAHHQAHAQAPRGGCRDAHPQAILPATAQTARSPAPRASTLPAGIDGACAQSHVRVRCRYPVGTPSRQPMKTQCTTKCSP